MLELKNICKRYVTSSFTQVALDDVSLAFRDNEFVAILGPSGSGKTTMLNVIGGLDHFDSGDLMIDGISTKDFRDRDWDAYRNNRIGFVFQSYNLIPHQTILENVELALTLTGVGRAERKRRAREALEKVGLGQHVDKRPSQLSGGQMQRVAIARALINDPEIVLADEPTGALDSTTSVQVMDLLKEVAQDRLVIMVTHNPELAYQYATRIVNLADGRITDDSDPFDADAAPRREAKATRRTSMSFLTALGLSARNLMTKKGRTIMTAFAGSIGIIGIAAILALSNGVNGYIAKVEEDTLSGYPLTISKQSYDMSSMLGGSSASDDSSSGSAEGEKGESSDASTTIPVITAVKDMFASVKSNDMTSFKEFLDGGGDGISDDVNAIQYGYGITPIVYRESSDGTSPTKLVPNAMTESLTTGMASTVSSSMSGTDVFNEMLDDRELLESQYDVVAGRWAESADEAVLVLTRKGSVSDYTLYSIGALDINELNDLVSNSLSEDGSVEVPESDASFTYEDALNTSFKILSSSDLYRKNGETGGWTDMSDDADYVAEKVANGLDLHIVGVVMPNGSTDSTALSAGIAYTHALTVELMDRAANSDIVKQQLSDPDTDVFTGKSFADLQDEAKSGVDLQSLFTIDESAIASAFSFDTSALSGIGGNVDVSQLMSGVDFSSIQLDLTGVGADIDYESILGAAPTPDFSSVFDGDAKISADELEKLNANASKLLSGYLNYLTTNGGDLDPTTDDFASKVLESFNKYVESDKDAKAILDEITSVAGDAATEKLLAAFRTYAQDQLAPYMQQAISTLASKLSDEITQTVSAQMSSAMTQVMDQVAQNMAGVYSGIGTQLQSALSGALSVDASALANAFQFNMDVEDLTSLMTSYANASTLTYDNNLTKLGYADESNPSSIKIYPKDFDAKERVLDHIDTYNDRMKQAGEDDKVISYTDYVGILMTSVTEIVNMISMVLIAFVSISLVVSSIMIGIITYISVLERKKEIGILRAIGASKGNVASVFNAETFIEGLISGVFAIAVVLVVSVPVNAYVLETKNVPNIMTLPWSSALMLIGISIVLTVVAGLLPARSASKKDPVEALRSE